ncbi:MAG TPA: hypothetical protein PKX23_11645 [Verrucomicrobiota bacterium]|jgi:hypothetical protein|nr:hypothetical protein [Verrucomicrobiota bacterium]HRT07248.1 hypothetical protein [Candidatus Paceibacterota bacterium]HRT59053.1 hypothetical protein [Candidatus Paceibacterota bacterium]
MKRQTKNQTASETRQTPALRQETQPAVLEFNSVEELLRHDAIHTPVPPAIEHRLARALPAPPPQPAGPWWRRWFRGKRS